MAASTALAETWRLQDQRRGSGWGKLLAAAVLAGALFLVIDLAPAPVGAAGVLYAFVVLLCAGEVSARHLREIGLACGGLATLALLARPGQTGPYEAINLLITLALIAVLTIRTAHDVEAAQGARAGQAHARSAFDKVGAVLWVEDYSGVRSALAALRDLGVHDLEVYLREDPRFVDRMAARVRPVDINARGLEMLDADSREAFFAGHPAILSSVGEAFRSVLLAYWRGCAEHQTRARLVGLRGRAVDAVVTVTFPAQADPGGHVVVSFTDVSPLIDAQAADEEAQRDLAQVARSATLEALVAAITQQISQPLEAILHGAQTGAGQLVHSPPQVAQAYERFNLIVAEALRVNDHLRAIRASLPLRPRQPTALNLDAVVADTLALVERDLGRLGVAVEHAPSAVAPFVLADRLALQQALINLLINAAQAVHPQDERAPITVVVDASEHRACVKVVDRGPGLGVLCPKALFEPFFTTRADGMGLGLSVARAVAEAHDGDIRAEATPGGGATFIVDLPRLVAS